MSKFNDIANATLKIEAGGSSGSGFHFIDKQIIVTNYHVVECAIRNSRIPIIGKTESGATFRLQVICHSPANQYDFAILHSIDNVTDDRFVLQPKISDRISRGMDVLFAGYPHGISHLLVHKAIVSGYPNEKSFYIDGSVSGGNSGGPIVDMEEMTVVGIVTQRRFLGGSELSQMQSEAHKLSQHCDQLKGRGTVNIMGIDFASFAGMVGRSFEISKAIIEANANSGIGIGFNIKFATEAYHKILK